jgi:heptosyltransferase-1
MVLDVPSQNSDQSPQGRRFLIILTGALGDVTRGLVLVNQIRAHEPHARVDWLIEKKWESLLTLHDHITERIVFDRVRPLRSFFSIWRSLRRNSYDVVIDLQRIAKSGLFSLLSGAPLRIGFHPRNSKEGNWLCNTGYAPYLDETRVAKIIHYLSFLKTLGIPQSEVSTGLRLPPLEDAQAKVREAVEQPYILIVLGASWHSKKWPSDGYAGLIDILKERYPELRAVFVGDKGELEQGATLEKQSGGISLVGETSLTELCTVIGRAEVCVGPDSGPAHLAGAYGVPYVTLFGPTSPRRVAPLGSEHLTVSSDIGCSPCYRRVCPGLGGLCMRLISPQEVAEQVTKAIVQSA